MTHGDTGVGPRMEPAELGHPRDGQRRRVNLQRRGEGELGRVVSKVKGVE